MGHLLLELYLRIYYSFNDTVSNLYIKKIEMGGACNTYWGGEMFTVFLWGTPKGEKRPGRTRRRSEKILKWMLEKLVEGWSELDRSG
jgi:hypothetical protein